MEYQLLEPSISSDLGLQSLTNGVASLVASTSFIYGALIMIIVVAAAFRYGLAGIWRIEASSTKIAKSNEEIKRVTLGLLGVLSLFLLISTLNRDLLTGDVQLNNLGTGSVVATGGIVSGGGGNFGGGGASGNTGGPSSGVSCESKEKTIASLTSSSGICGSTSCSVLSGCGYKEYLPILKQEAQKNGIDVKMAIVIMCKESRGKKDAQNKNPNGTYDCGLMQINQQAPCDASILDPATNISRGVSLIKSITASTKQVYPNIPSQAGIFSSYNCCANGTIPNAPSADCNQSSGFPYSIPKWACPINPGEGTYNMCVVKKYTCELTACLQDPSLNGM